MKDKFNFISGFMAGAAVCAAVMLYLQSEEGRETATKVKETLKRAGSKLLSTLEEMDDLMQEVVEQGKSFTRGDEPSEVKA